jgi:hypothetical protein
MEAPFRPLADWRIFRKSKNTSNFLLLFGRQGVHECPWAESPKHAFRKRGSYLFQQLPALSKMQKMVERDERITPSHK